MFPVRDPAQTPRNIAEYSRELPPRKFAPLDNDESPGRYRIQAVAEMTGISAATLRAWERRYGVPMPKRTSSAYRVYSERDVEIVRVVRQLCEAGMAPSQAAREVLARRRAAASSAPDADEDTELFHLACSRILEAVATFDSERIAAAVQRALFLGPSITVFERVFSPTLATIGERWRRGSLSVAQEHLAAQIIGDAVHSMLRAAQPSTGDHRVLLACFADEEHVTPLYGIALHFAEWGFKTVMLGAKTPPRALRDAIAAVHPDIVGLSLTIELPPERAGAQVNDYAAACASLPWLVGGVAAPSISHHVEASGGAIARGSAQSCHELVLRMVQSHRASAHH